jgi:predicted CoA-substrate-specific enzyme activase
MMSYLGIDCGSVSINLALMRNGADEPITVYRRTRGRPLVEFIAAVEDLLETYGDNIVLNTAMVTGSGRDLLANTLNLPAVNEITAHAAGAFHVNPDIRTIIEIGGQDSKFITIEPTPGSDIPRIPIFRMNEICAAGTGAFLDEQSQRLGLAVESFGSVALQSETPAPIAGRCAVFAKTDMIHQAQEGTSIPDILLGLAFALVRNYIATLVKGEQLGPLVSLQGGVMSNPAVVHAFRKLLNLGDNEVIIPPHFKVLGALGSAVLAQRLEFKEPFALKDLIGTAQNALRSPPSRSYLPPLNSSLRRDSPGSTPRCRVSDCVKPIVLGLDIGSVSVKGVLIDSRGSIVRQEYLLSKSRTFEAVEAVLTSLLKDDVTPDAISVTGSGRYLVGRLLDADLIVDEITAQSKAALSYSSEVDTVVEIGGQDSKWISLEQGSLKDFEMNRVCAAGTGSFLMAQAQRLDLPMGQRFSDAAFSSPTPADLGNRCTVFMESDLIHHQNNGASSEDLAAGVCMSIVQNYLERVANNKQLGGHVLFLGGVAANPAVRAAFEQHTGQTFHTPDFFTVSGALGTALKALDGLRSGNIQPKKRKTITLEKEQIKAEQFTCKGCTNRCAISKYTARERVVFQGGLCDRWELEQRTSRAKHFAEPFKVRLQLLDEYGRDKSDSPGVTWGMVRSPQFYEWFPFWHGFCRELGISLAVAPRAGRKQFERGQRYLRVETCLPMKALSGQIDDLVRSGVRTLFHPSILNEQPIGGSGDPVEYCPYIQASSQLYRGAFDVEWQEPIISYALDPDSFRNDHLRFAADLGFSRKRAAEAFHKGMESQNTFNARLRAAGESFLNSLGQEDQAFIILGKPYHSSDSFLNMNLANIFDRLGIPALPSDLFPLEYSEEKPSVYWKYQEHMVRVAHELSQDPRLFPILITFFGCGPDPFVLRHIRDNLGDKPLLILEMDEHTSRAGLLTRIEAFVERIKQRRGETTSPRVDNVRSLFPQSPDTPEMESNALMSGWHALSSKAAAYAASLKWDGGTDRIQKHRAAETMYLPYMSDHSYGFAAAARSVGMDVRVLPPPDQESEKLGRPHMVGGECHPYALILGDYLKLAQQVAPHDAERSLFYIISPSVCRLGQYPVYIDKVRRNLGLGIGVISEVEQGLEAFGLSGRNRQRVFLRAWESMNAYDALFRIYLQIRPRVKDKTNFERLYLGSRDKLFNGICAGDVRHGLEDALHDLYNVSIVDTSPRPVVAVTGDYYTRVVPFANNDVYREIEDLGATVLPPPTFSDCLKLATLRDATWTFWNGSSRKAASKSLLYGLLAVSEFKLKGSRSMKRAFQEPLDILGRNMWKTASQHIHTKLPSGITAPIVTALHQVDQGADGLLNLMTLNCSYGTVVTASLSRALRDRPGIPMLTLIYDGLKKTNEKTRLEAFMDQVKDNFACRLSTENPRGPYAKAL